MARSTYVTGFCSSGAHVGLKVLSANGALLRSCSGEYTFGDKKFVCACICHDEMRQMLAMAGLLDDKGVSLLVAPPTDTQTVERTVGEPARPASVPVESAPEPPEDRSASSPMRFSSTESGRLARGELEERIRLACVSGLQLVGEMVAYCEVHYGTTPSTGAITAVFGRWQKLGLAEIERNPLRFVKFSDEVVRDGFYVVKDRRKSLRKKTSPARRFKW